MCVDDVLSIAGGYFSGLYYQFYTISFFHPAYRITHVSTHTRHINMSTLQERSL